MDADRMVSSHLHSHPEGAAYLAEELDRILRRCIAQHPAALEGWQIQGLVMNHPGSRGDMLVIRGRTTGAAMPFPWRLLDDAVREIAAFTWRVVAIIPDIESAAPVLVEHSRWNQTA